MDIEGILEKTKVNYWDTFYQKTHTLQPSSFAKFCSSYFKTNSLLIDLGCGNGRDSLYFAEEGHKVISVDNSKVALDLIQSYNHPNIMPLLVGSTKINQKLDVIYARFFIHAVKEDVEDETINMARDLLNEGGYFCIEARSDKGSFQGDHFRRFINFEKIKNKLSNFKIIYSEEKTGLAPNYDEDPMIIRLIVQK